MLFKTLRLFFFLVVLIVLGVSLTGCSTAGQGNGGSALHMMPLEEMPPEVQAAPVTVQQAYQFAAANRDVMEHIPCYCGCGKIGHKSNYACYVQGVDDQQKITFDTHALGCSLCVDITQDTMRLLKQGKSLQEIKGYVDSTYSKYGPSNIQ